MHDTRSQHPAPLRRLPHLLIAFALVSAVAAGCGGGSKPADNAASETPAAEPAPARIPVPESSATATLAPASEAPAAAADLGAQVFTKRCVLCHGPQGRGDGVAAKGLNPQPRNFHDTAYMGTRTDAQLLEVIHKGKGAMPRWEGQLSEAEIAAVLKHVRELGKQP